MTWQTLVPFVIPVATAFVAFRRTGIQRLIAIVATLAALGCYTLPLLTETIKARVPGIDDFALSTATMVLFAIGLICIMVLMAGDLKHRSQWLAVGIGAVLIVAFFASLWFVIAGLDCQFSQINLALQRSNAPAPGYCGSSSFLVAGGSAALVIMGLSAALFPLAKALIVDVPGAIDSLQKLRAERAAPGAARQRWHPAQWLTVGAGALLFAGVMVLVYLHAIAEDPAVILMTAGVMIGAVGPRVVGWLLSLRNPAAQSEPSSPPYS